ncbi:radical SAM/SPASM domain-containing protein [Adlercreutzia muris]|jgi:radical SAM protein with 4Fe4S-binding SPASM domain|uniref:radical SAM/SPASM domain-containing protein n=1 Tax=Adlercreutzia muris TaxID=1796610 RepID=UPI00136665D7|nr:radical SAM protein [Adlercreutzia muris]MCI9673076.1 radical SAM protein [Enterorhabdus sp.]
MEKRKGILFAVEGLSLFGNPRTGHLIGLESDEIPLCVAYAKGKISLESVRMANESLGRQLEEGGFDQMDEPRPRAAYLHVTQRCNLACVGCYSCDEGRNMAADPTLGQIASALSFLAEQGVDVLNISGGEPLMRDDLPDIAALAHETYGIAQVNILTNGTIGRRGILERCAPFIHRLSVSFDGVTADDPAWVRGAQRFNDLVAFVGLAQDVGIEVCITPTIHRKNVEDIPRYRALADQLGVEVGFSLLSQTSRRWEDAGLVPTDRELERIARLAVEAATVEGDRPIDELASGLSCRESCGAGTSAISIDADGSIYPCHMMHDPRFRMGNAFRGNGATFQRMRCPPDSVPDECEECEYRYLCGAGCPARAYGSESGRDPYCMLHKTFYGEVVRQIKERLG